MAQADAIYFARRADAELRLARRATDPKAVAAHFELSNAYRQRASALIAERQFWR